MEHLKVRKTTFEKDLEEKEAYFLALTPIERLKINTEINERMFSGNVDSDKLKLKIVRK